jgi:hypothetical protein
MTDDILRNAAAALGRKGGQSKSAAKVAASRANGLKNRNKKSAIPVFLPPPRTRPKDAPIFPTLLVEPNGGK